MGKKLISILVSTRLTAFLFISFSAAMAAGTFIESMHGTEASKILVYNALWFEIMMILFVVNFTYNIKRYRLLSREKLPVLLLHLSWILIIIGAGITRYIGYEGIMPIREGSSSNQFLSSDTYITILVDGEINGQQKRKKLEKKVLFSEYTNNNFTIKDDFNKQKFSVEYVDFIENVDYGVVPNDFGTDFLKIVEASSGERHDHYIESGQVTNIHGVLFTLNNRVDGAINIISEGYDLFIESSFNGGFMRMIDQFSGVVEKNIKDEIQYKSLYNIAGLQFVIPEPVIKGKYELIKNKDEDTNQNMLKLKVVSNGIEEFIELAGGKGIADQYETFNISGLDFSIKYGSLLSQIPFNIKLNDFIAEKYPGTEKSYSSFMSKVSVDGDQKFDYDIYMNHILNHKGYRFFQASFDPDEKGTILSVNQDFFGTFITYLGYILLYIGLLGIMFYGKTRFKDLGKKLKKLKQKRIAITIILFLIFTNSYSQNDYSHKNQNFISDSVIKNYVIDEIHSKKFGEVIIQDSGGRMKPLNTFSSELLRKVSKSDKYNGLNSDQVFISILRNPLAWYSEPLIYIKRGNDSIRSVIGIDSDQKFASFIDFFDGKGNYKISKYLEKAYKSSLPNQFEKDFIETDRRVNLLFSALEGEILKIFPIPNDSNNKWISSNEVSSENFETVDSLFTTNIIPLYLRELDKSLVSKNYQNAEKILESIKGFQIKYGEKILPSDDKIKAEILYNKYDIFKTLFLYYFLAGLIFFLFIIIQIFISSTKLNQLFKYLFVVFRSVIFILFVIHTFGLIARGYISGHAPWSDAYESMIYVSWATMGIGLLFSRKSDLTLASTSFVTSMILMIAHWNWMDPSIANLVPVLDSYWLMIHVSIIVGSYGPFALATILGIVALFLMILSTKSNYLIIKNKLSEITIINELALTIGLIMLTIGNFLGGMWANESWGRYWGWDPKETWALISILIYAFVLHMRLIPKMRGMWLFNLMSIIAFASIVMTYFGVNFYLVGLHSYASGDKVITPNFVYYSILFVFILGLISKYKYNKFLVK
ncbi:cytochrome c biogenesis protein CcsA [Flavobacteriales bacterium]|nr:cytochrome c biogenesis protein CcsA [Flavobacteriales bacterium]